MKTIVLVRHAKSDWPENTDDFDRPLAEKGKKDAEKMAVLLKKNGLSIDLMVSSPAIRAFDTCTIFNLAFETEVQTNRKLYNPLEQNFSEIIYELDDRFSTVAFFSHNNGISNFANSLTEEIFHFPTCGVAGFAADCNSWADFEVAEKRFLFFYEANLI